MGIRSGRSPRSIGDRGIGPRRNWGSSEIWQELPSEIELRLLTHNEEQHNAALLESIDHGVYSIDTHGCCTFINPAPERILGYPEREVLGKNMHELIHHHYADGSCYPENACPIFQAFQTSQGIRIDDEVFWRRDGTSFSAEYSSSPIFGGQTTTSAGDRLR